MWVGGAGGSEGPAPWQLVPTLCHLGVMKHPKSRELPGAACRSLSRLQVRWVSRRSSVSPDDVFQAGFQAGLFHQPLPSVKQKAVYTEKM